MIFDLSLWLDVRMRYADIKWVDNLPRSELYSDLYYSSSDGLAESEYVFITQNNLIERFKNNNQFTIAEAGFGTGLNFIATCRRWLENSPDDAVLHYVGIENNPVSPDDIRRVSAVWSELKIHYDELLLRYPPAMKGTHLLLLFNGRVRLTLDFLDISVALSGRRFQADTWYLDGFDPKNNEAMWNDALVNKLAAHSKTGTTLSTYSAAGHVRRRLTESGFSVLKVKGHAKKREMITAVYDGQNRYESHCPWYETPLTPPTVLTDHNNAVIVGAGLAGLTSALVLIEHGWHVTLIDKHENVAEEASGNPAGILLPRISLGNDDEQQFYINAYLHAINRLNVLQQEAGDEQEFWHATGVFSQELTAKSTKILENYDAGFVREAIPDSRFRHKENHTTLFFPTAGWVSTRELCLLLFRQCNGKVKYRKALVNNIEKTETLWQVSDSNGVVDKAPVVILASGTSVKDFANTSWLPVCAIRGQMTELDASDSSESYASAYSFGRFFTPAFKGKHYTGASYDKENTSSSLSSGTQAENITQLNNMLTQPFEEPEALTGRAGLRTVSEDRMPIVGLVPDVDWFEKHYSDLHFGRAVDRYQPGQYHQGLYVNTAHGSRGLTSCFLSAEYICSQIHSSPLPFSFSLANTLSPARFLIRRLKRNQKVTG